MFNKLVVMLLAIPEVLMIFSDLQLWVYRLIIYLQITIQMLIDKREASMRVFPAVSITFRESEYMK